MVQDHKALLEVYHEARSIKGIKKITIGSGIRYDLIIDPKNKPVSASAIEYLKELVVHHVSGRLKVAPEHTSGKVLKLLRKPPFESYIHLHERFTALSDEYGLNQQLIPYFISSLPDCGLDEMAELAIEAGKLHLNLEQVQDFTPTPMTLGSVMYYAGFDPYTLKKVAVPRTVREKKMQQLFFFLYKKEKREELKTELRSMQRGDLIKSLNL